VSIKKKKSHQMSLHTDYYTIKPSEINTQNHLTTPVLFDFMQQSASKNAETLGVGVEKMRESNLAWVLNRLKLTVERYPKLGERVALSTYPVRIDKYFVYRDFQLHDAEGILIAHAVSVWLLLDLTKRTMSSVPNFVHQIEYPIITHPLPPISGKVLPLKTVDFSVKRTVIAEDVDFNQHTSNVSYVKWLVEAMPLAVQNNCFVKELDINYRAECYLDEPIVIETYQKDIKSLENALDTEGGYFQQKILRESDKKDLVWANVIWATV
jgi:medium-chain acyl-[acyl-carrier-protein] hydrolase